jgi:ketosteroid isomerase-like protein
MRAPLIAVLVLLSGCASTAPGSAADPQIVVAAERAFAADAARHGWAWAFRRYHAPDALVLQPDPVQAAISLARVEGDGNTNLDWRPAYGGIARSGDLGFTTGPFLFRGNPRVVGHYFTVWRRQPDGTWKWIFDAGTDVTDAAPVDPDYNVPTLPIAESGAGSAQAAIDQVAAIEDSAAEGADGLAVLALRLAESARVNRVGVAPAVGRADAEPLMRRDGAAKARTLLREASQAGDLVFTMGEMRDQSDGSERLRYFARIWQHQSGEWRIVFDEIVPRRAQ